MKILTQTPHSNRNANNTGTWSHQVRVLFVFDTQELFSGSGVKIVLIGRIELNDELCALVDAERNVLCRRKDNARCKGFFMNQIRLHRDII